MAIKTENFEVELFWNNKTYHIICDRVHFESFAPQKKKWELVGYLMNSEKSRVGQEEMTRLMSKYHGGPK